MSNILSNIAALKSLYHLSRNQDGYATSMERIASGKRINAAGDDAAAEDAPADAEEKGADAPAKKDGE